MWMSGLQVMKDFPWFIFIEKSRFQPRSDIETLM